MRSTTMKIILATTRFNNQTLSENAHYYRREINENGCLYGSPIRMKGHIHVKADVMVLEMNNSENKIVGIGWIKNYVYMDKYYKIYSDGNYNRYIYKGKYRIQRHEFHEDEMKIIEVLEYLLFYGSKHSKRGQGICEIPSWIKENKHKYDFVAAIKTMFTKRNLIKKPILNI